MTKHGKDSAPQFKRVGCYLRVSTESQIENYSIDEQKERLTAYCKSKGWAIYRYYIDPGYSGGNMNRPALQEMLKDIKDKNIDIVAVYKLDRLSRSQKDTLTLIEDEFVSNGVDFVSVNENFDTTSPFGRAMIGILSVFAQLEKDQITERFTMGRIGRAKSGYYHGGATPPTGYDYIDGNLVVNEYEAVQVKEVFDRFLKGHSIHAIRRYMNENFKTKSGAWSSHTLVLNILKNSVYIGKVKFGGEEYDGQHEPIISEETYQSAQKLLQSSEREAKKTTPQKFPFRASLLLTGLLVCKRCGSRYAGDHGYYKCYSRSKSSKKYITDPNCKNENWAVEELDDIVKNAIIRLKFDDSYLKEVSKRRTPATPHENITNAIQNKIKDIDGQISRLIDLYQIGGIPAEDIKSRVDILQKEKSGLLSQAEKVGHDKKASKSDTKKLLNKADYIFNNSPLDEQRLFVRSLINYIEIDGKRLDIHWRI